MKSVVVASSSSSNRRNHTDTHTHTHTLCEKRQARELTGSSRRKARQVVLGTERMQEVRGANVVVVVNVARAGTTFKGI